MLLNEVDKYWAYSKWVTYNANYSYIRAITYGSIFCLSFQTSRSMAHVTDKKQKQTISVAFSPRANYTDWATATCRRNLVPTFVERGVSRGQRGGSPTAVNLSFLNRHVTDTPPIYTYVRIASSYVMTKGSNIVGGYQRSVTIYCLHVTSSSSDTTQCHDPKDNLTSFQYRGEAQCYVVHCATTALLCLVIIDTFWNFVPCSST
jgi:hypothetical protein